MSTSSTTTIRPLDEGWTFREAAPRDIPHADQVAWQPAVVPGHVHLDLMRLGVIPDPFERMHERTVQWVDDVDWQYRCEFDLAADVVRDGRHILRFAGLDTVASVRLNGTLVGEADNQFVAHEFDVTSALRAGANVVEVHFAPAHRVGEQRRAAWLAEDESRARYEHGLLPRTMVRKAQYSWGWDWGPCLRGCGIWQPVTLVHVPAARLEDWSVATDFTRSACAVTIAVAVSGAASAVEVRVSGHGGDAVGSAPVIDGRATVTVELTDPLRWWPAGMGDQPLYDVTLSAVGDSGIVDTRRGRIGLRDIELVHEPDAVGESFYFRVNGVAFFAKGANWIPDDLFPARTTPDRVRHILALARDCGMNMIRVWGGGFYESDDFYDACDELGLLVWQDFPYACAMYADDDTTSAAADAEARTAIRRIRTHPSLALWCGNNENQWLIGMGFFGTKEVFGARLYEETLRQAVAAEDPASSYWPGSPYGASSTAAPEGEFDAVTRRTSGAVTLAELAAQGHNDETVGDCHYWNVWHGAGDWRHYAECRARFVSEFGFSGPPTGATLAQVLDPDELGVDTPAMRWHDKTGKGYETYLGYIHLHYPKAETFDDLVYYGQCNQADALRYGIEHFRRLAPRTMGTLAWQLNDCWPVQSWAWVDSALRPKAVWYAARRLRAAARELDDRRRRAAVHRGERRRC